MVWWWLIDRFGLTELTTIKTEQSAFKDTQSLTLKGMIMINVFIWSS